LWTAAISWGVTTTEKSFKRWGYVCAAMGVALAVFAGIAIYGAVTYEVSDEEMTAWQTLAAVDTDPAEGQPGPDAAAAPPAP
ncbi:hypothetical protein, partial [Burkholderia sp. SIMBA_024]|uniref:hypothetical protein n=1 Tax=Burkholderia sp. SIMBA_024 TaxID=3085768 RepID=UPI00397D524F